MSTMTYGSLNLLSGGIYVTDTDIDDTPTKVVQSEKLAEADGAIFVKTTYEPKTFKIEGYLKTDLVADLRPLINTFKAALNLEEQNFDYDDGSGTLRYIATARKVFISRPRGLNVAAFSVEFICESPVGADTSGSTLLGFTAISTASVSTALTVGGSYKAEPLITVTIATVTGGTAKTVGISNDTTLRGISITRTWANGDVIEIDCLNKTVFVNDAVVEYTGQFPTWDVGPGSIAYLDDFTTRSVTLSATYTRRYL